MSRARTFADLATASEAGNLGQTNIIINGDMSVAQRGTSSTSSNFQTVDRMSVGYGTISVTQSQQSLTSGSPYEAGFNNFIRMANTSTSSNAGAYVQLNQGIEAQDIANSGWNFKSSSSFVTLSFWARSSLAGTYYVRINTDDGTTYYRIKAFALSADTWTKVTFTIEGNSNLTINDDNGAGLQVVIVPHYGTTFTGSNASTTAWYTLVSNDYFPDYAQNWANTSSATFDVTGVQLELGQVATPYKHEDFADNLARCQRYYRQQNATAIYTRYAGAGRAYDTQNAEFYDNHPVQMRAIPTLVQTGTASNYAIYHQNAVLACSTVPTISSSYSTPNIAVIYFSVSSGLTVGQAMTAISNNNTDSFIGYNAEF